MSSTTDPTTPRNNLGQATIQAAMQSAQPNTNAARRQAQIANFQLARPVYPIASPGPAPGPVGGRKRKTIRKTCRNKNKRKTRR